MIKYCCSDGSRVSESTIRKRYSDSLKEKHAFNIPSRCEMSGEKCLGRPTDNSHIIAKAHLKTLHKTDLIWSPDCYESVCRNCHSEWESYRAGEWIRHERGLLNRLQYLFTHDPEGFRKRVNFDYEQKDLIYLMQIVELIN